MVRVIELVAISVPTVVATTLASVLAPKVIGVLPATAESTALSSLTLVPLLVSRTLVPEATLAPTTVCPFTTSTSVAITSVVASAELASVPVFTSYAAQVGWYVHVPSTMT
jgi:hypothetical protein